MWFASATTKNVLTFTGATRPLPSSCFACPDRARVPELGFGDVSDGVRHLLLFALDLLTVGQIDAEVNSDYVQGLGWYHTLTGVLAGNEDGV